MKIKILSESLSSAIKKYGQEIANYVSKFDPTPTFKYVEWLCGEMEQITIYFINNGEEDDPESKNLQQHILKILTKFDKISKNLQKKDINKYDDWIELKDAVNNYKTKKESKDVLKKLHPESKKIFENDKAIVIRVYSYEASLQYGKGKFCIAATESHGGVEMWDEYTGDGMIFFYIFDKKDFNPFVVVINEDEEDDDVFELWNKSNQQVNNKSVEKFLKNYNLNIDIFYKNADSADRFNKEYINKNFIKFIYKITKIGYNLKWEDYKLAEKFVEKGANPNNDPNCNIVELFYTICRHRYLPLMDLFLKNKFIPQIVMNDVLLTTLQWYIENWYNGSSGGKSEGYMVLRLIESGAKIGTLKYYKPDFKQKILKAYKEVMKRKKEIKEEYDIHNLFFIRDTEEWDEN